MSVNKRELLSTFFTVVQSEDFVCCVVPTELGVCTLCGMVLCDTGGLGVNKVQFTGGHICGYGAFHELRTFIMCLPMQVVLFCGTVKGHVLKNGLLIKCYVSMMKALADAFMFHFVKHIE